MNEKKVVIIVSSPFYLNDYDRFGINNFLEKGFKIDICNVGPIIYPDFYKNAEKKNRYEGSLQKVFYKKKELKDYLLINKKNLFLLNIHYNYSTHFIFRIISNLNIDYLFSIINIVPSNIEIKKYISLKNYLNFKTILRVINNRLVGFLKKYFQKIKPPRYLIAGGIKSLESPQASIVNKSTKIIWTHTYDFDKYLDKEEQKFTKINPSENNFAVFLDAPSPIIKHDALIPGISSPLTADIYFPSLCNFFDEIEKNLNIKVIIAAHPKSKHLDRPKYFGGRKVCENMTIDLIKESKLVINRNSTAINFAILYSKPIVFHTSNQILKHHFMRDQINSMSNLLEKTPINIDKLENIDWNNELYINKELYKKYYNNYIKNPKSEKKYLWDIVIREIDNEKN